MMRMTLCTAANYRGQFRKDSSTVSCEGVSLAIQLSLYKLSSRAKIIAYHEYNAQRIEQNLTLLVATGHSQW